MEEESTTGLYSYRPEQSLEKESELLSLVFFIQKQITMKNLTSASPLEKAWGYTLLANLTQILPEKQEETEEYLKNAVNAAPRKSYFHLQLSKSYLSSGNPAKSLKAIRNAENLDPENPDILYLKTMVLISLKQVDEAVKTLDKLVELQADNAQILLKAAQIYDRLKMTNRAEQTWRKLFNVTDNPDLKNLCREKLKQQQ